MSQACLTQYFTPKRSRLTSTVLANGESVKSSKRKIKFDDENNENQCTSNKKRRITPDKGTDGFLAECDLDQIDRVAPLSRKNRPETEERKVKTFERENIRLKKIVDVKELRQHLDAVRNHIELEKEKTNVDFETPKKSLPAHERFANLLVEKPSLNETPKKFASPNDLRRCVQENEAERLKKVLSKVDQTTLDALPTTPSKKIVGVKSSLLEKIRLKEQARSQLDTLESNGLIVNEQKRTENVDKLHYLRESVEILDQMFTTERQVALECEKIREKLVELHSAKFTSENGAQMFDFVLENMEQCLPGYLTPIKLRNKQYLKINRIKYSLSQLNEFVQRKMIALSE